MDYQDLYAKYQAAVNLRELNNDKKFELLKEIFMEKIVSSISLSAQENVIPYLSGIKEVFNYVESEVGKINVYRDELDRIFAEQK
jgi:hypothetical protein